MSRRLVVSLAALAALVAIVVTTVDGQAGSPSRVTHRVGVEVRPAAKTTTITATPWVPPRTVDGQPDLQGVLGNNSVTPLQRPRAWAGKEFLTDADVAELKTLAANVLDGDGDAIFGDGLVDQALAGVKGGKSYDPTTGNYNHFWLVQRDFDNRTSLITDPADGRLPPLTPEAERRRAAATEARKLHPADGPEDRPTSERCITYGVPSLFAGYNSYYQILQTPGYVAIAMEMIHDARIIPLDGRPHLRDDVRQWHGDSRGHWEGQTLVVETRNFSPKSTYMGASEDVHMVERFTRVSPNTLNYEITANDAKTWTKPWTVMVPLRRSEDKVYEYACHEGNYGMTNLLSGARALERHEAAKKTESR